MTRRLQNNLKLFIGPDRREEMEKVKQELHFQVGKYMIRVRTGHDFGIAASLPIAIFRLCNVCIYAKESYKADTPSLRQNYYKIVIEF